MFRSSISSKIVIYAIVAIIAVQKASALKCWECSNILQPSFCGAKWDESKITAQDKTNFYSDCQGTCLKTAASWNGETIAVTRSCALNEGLVKAQCDEAHNAMHEAYPKADFKCVTCGSDGCNGAAQYGPIALLIALPVAIAKIFLF